MLTGFELAFAICAAIGGVLFLGRFVLQLLGFQHDVAMDISSGDLDLANSDLGFKLLSFQSLTAFLTMFGLVGFALHRTTEGGPIVAVGGAIVAGALTAWLIALLFRGMSRLQSTSDYNPAQAIGQKATVYLTIPASDTGKVTVTINNRLSVLDAVAFDRQEIKTGEIVTVVELLNQNVLVVKKVS